MRLGARAANVVSAMPDHMGRHDGALVPGLLASEHALAHVDAPRPNGEFINSSPAGRTEEGRREEAAAAPRALKRKREEASREDNSAKRPRTTRAADSAGSLHNKQLDALSKGCAGSFCQRCGAYHGASFVKLCRHFYGVNAPFLLGDVAEKLGAPVSRAPPA